MEMTDTPLSQQPAEAAVVVEVEPESEGEAEAEAELGIRTDQIPSNMPNSEPSAPAQPQPSSNPPDRRCLLGNKDDFRLICVPLYQASIKGNWEAAERIINERVGVTGYYITENEETALHIAASAKSSMVMEDFVTKLVFRMRMNPEDLEIRNKNNNTALCLAAAGDNVNIAKLIVNCNESLLNIPGGQDGTMLPLYIASLYGKHGIVDYLYEKSNNMDDNNIWDDEKRGWVLWRCVEAGLFDIALKIVEHRPVLAKSMETLGALARKTDAFKEGSYVMELLRSIWTYIMENVDKHEINRIIRGPTSDRGRTHTSRVLFIAAEVGNTNFIVELIRQYPDLIWKLNDRNQSIFHVAVLHRQEGVYNLIYEIGSMKDFITPQRDVGGNNMLHLAAKSAKKKRLQETSGVALQMQRELLWYKEVESILPPSYQEKKNNVGLLPHELFTNEHKDLMSASEKWMKDTASHCMVVAALIATVVFAAAFTVPGGYDNDKGYPILRNHRAFIFFVISDAISLTFATISILMFLHILTSRYAEQDFLETLPKKLMIGLATLFLSIATMMFAFSASFFTLYGNDWVPILITVFASFPVLLYVILQTYGLLADVYHSTYGSKNLFKPKKPMLY